MSSRYYHTTCGIYSAAGNSENFPLVNTKVHYDLVDVQALATVTQLYVSDAKTSLEVKYVFPLPPDASVCAFKAVIDGQRTIRGVVKAKHKAQMEYDEAVSKGKTAALLTQDNVEIFQLSLGNIRPGQTIEVNISFASIISHDGELDSLRLTFPCVIAPRYGTPPNKLLNYISNVWRNTPSPKPTNLFEFSLSVQMASHIKSITSPSHTIEMKLGQSTSKSTTDFDPFKAYVSVTSPALLEKDVIIAMSCVGLDRPRCTVEAYSPAEGAQDLTHAYALTLVPRFELPPLPSQEYIFLVDRSGSMGGGKIEAVRSALQIMLRSLPPRGTSFNIISFGTEHSSLWPSSVAYTAESVMRASKYVDTMDANYGGTEISNAIRHAFLQSRSDPESSASIFILTDGEAYDLNGVQSTVATEIVKAKRSNRLLRLFCMGIGNSVSKAMCDLIARVGNGTAVYVAEDEKPDHKLMALLRAARGAVVEDISIDWGISDESKDMLNDTADFELVPGLDAPPDYPRDNLPPISLFDEKIVPDLQDETSKLGPDGSLVNLPPPPQIQQAPAFASLPPLYPGFRTSIFAIITPQEKRSAAPSKVVRINGTASGQKVHLEVPVIPVMAPHASANERNLKMLHVLAARALVQRFEDESGKASFMDLTKVAEVLRVAERYGIASSETSFVAIDEESINIGYSVGEQLPAQPMRPGGSDRRRDSTCAVGYGRSSGFAPLAPPPPPGHVSAVPLPPPLPRAAAPPPVLLAQAAPAPSAAMPSGAALMGPPKDTTPDLGAFFDDVATGPPKRKSKKTSMLFARSNSPQKDYLAKAQMVTGKAEKLARPDSQTLSVGIETFARLQDFQGFFPPSSALYHLLVKSSKAPALPPVLQQAGQDAEKIWCTMLCVVYLETTFKSEQDIWAIMVEKALSWVDDALQPAQGASVTQIREVLKQEAGKFILKA